MVKGIISGLTRMRGKTACAPVSLAVRAKRSLKGNYLKVTQYIILDTNIWVYKTKLLSDPISAALLFHLNQTNGKLVIPEVIEREVNANLTKVAHEACNQIKKQYRLLQKIFGYIDDYQLPIANNAPQIFSRKLDQLKDLVVKVPFTFPHATGALNRVIMGLPPNKPSTTKSQGDQQFKDSCVWEVAREYAERGEVVFITNDYGFFEQKKPEKGFAVPLIKEIEKLKHNISGFTDIDTFLKDIKDTIPKLKELIIRRVLNEHMKENKTLIDASEADHVGEISSISYKAFLTEINNIVAIQYTLKYAINNVVDIITEDPLGEGFMIVKGNCSFDYTNENLTKNSIDEISFQDINGSPLPGKGTTTFGRMSATMGRSINRYELRSKMPHEML